MNIPSVIEETNLSVAWCRSLQHIIDHKGYEVSPLVLTITEFEETELIRKALDSDLQNNGLDCIDTVASTIFPEALYQDSNFDRNVLYKNYDRILPRIKKIDRRNRNGTYFERLMAYGDLQKTNQLEIIITSLRGKVKRRSKLQASVFDPLKDHKSDAFQGFPCLQHVTFYKSESGGLILNSFYAIQYLYQRAYGNWLGLINLGKFVAKESQMNFERFNCFIGIEKLDNITRGEAEILLQNINQLDKG